MRYAVAPTLRGPAQLGHGGQELVDNPIQPVTVPGTLPLRRMSHPVRFMLGGEPSDEPISNVPSGAAHAAHKRQLTTVTLARITLARTRLECDGSITSAPRANPSSVRAPSAHAVRHVSVWRVTVLSGAFRPLPLSCVTDHTGFGTTKFGVPKNYFSAARAHH